MILSCDNWVMLLFANGDNAQEKLSELPDYNEAVSTTTIIIMATDSK
jgi:hypothetical protein